MKLLATLHRWVGATIGLVLIVLGLSGVALVWEDAWIGLPGANDPVVASAPRLAHAIAAAAAHHEGLARITFASEEIGLHQAAYRDGSGAYFNQDGQLVDQWASSWGRPELWIFDLHHYLLAGDLGKNLAGATGIAGLFFVVSGVILWWRTRRTFALRLWPRRVTRSALIRHHRDLGIIVAPVLFVSLLTGSAIVFKPLGALIAAPLPSRSAPSFTPIDSHVPSDWHAIVGFAQSNFPSAEIRRLQIAEDGATLRLRQPFEWTPNGRTYLKFDGSGTVGADLPSPRFDEQSLVEKLYPVHAGKAGGWLWKLLLTVAGLGLVLLGSLAGYGFWAFRNRAGSVAAE